MIDGVKGKIAFVTGSTRGIGWATAQHLAANGATVILNGRNDQALLDQRVAELNDKYDGGASGMLFDVADADKTSAAYKQIFSQHRRLDILVNNAGVLGDALLGMISADLIRDTLAVNTVAPINHMQLAGRLMSRQKNGAIVNVTSIIGIRGNAGQCVYAASKSALLGLTLAASKELASQNIRVNAVAPGFIDTEMARSISADKFGERCRSIAMGRIGTADDVAKVILFLVSDLASYVTGQVIGVDGGMLI